MTAHQIPQMTGAIFDCDGTLLDSMDAWNAAEEAIIAQAVQPLSAQDMESVRALPIEGAAEIFHRYGVGDSPAHVLQMIDDHLLSFYQHEVNPLPGAVKLVESLDQVGIPMTVVSSSPMRYLNAGLTRAGIASKFVEIISTEEVNRSKQDPEIYRYAARKMGSDLSSTWGFDDATYAIRAMKQAGIHTMGVYACDETAESYEVLSATAERCVRSLSELL